MRINISSAYIPANPTAMHNHFRIFTIVITLNSNKKDEKNRLKIENNDMTIICRKKIYKNSPYFSWL